MSPTPFDAAPRNRILAALPPEELARLAPHLEHVMTEVRQLVFDVDRPIERVYFPEAAVISILGVMADGTAVETATVGREGMVGLPVFLGTDRTSAQAFTQISGPAYRMSAAAFRAAIAASPTLTLTLHRYTQALFVLVAQSSACNRLHSMQERCARWMLHTHDRVSTGPETSEFPLTHDFLSQMLGVRRATVTEAMQGLQATGALTYQMGRVRVLDRPQLEAETCECYTIIVREFDRLLGASGPVAAGPSPFDGLKLSEGGRSLLGESIPRRDAEPATDER